MIVLTWEYQEKNSIVNSCQYCLNPWKPEANQLIAKPPRNGETRTKISRESFDLKVVLCQSKVASNNPPTRLGKSPLSKFNFCCFSPSKEATANKKSIDIPAWATSPEFQVRVRIIALVAAPIPNSHNLLFYSDLTLIREVAFICSKINLDCNQTRQLSKVRTSAISLASSSSIRFGLAFRSYL